MTTIRDPLTLANGVALPNRIVKSAMSEALADERGDASNGQVAIYARWGRGGAGMLITGNAMVDRRHLEHPANFVLDEHSDTTRTRRLAAAMKGGGAVALAQLNHPGRQQGAEDFGHAPLSISDVRLDLPGYAQPVAADEAALAEVIAKFARAAALAEEAGFDGVEIHCAHGYLLSSALSPAINTRADCWGGSLANRARLAVAVVDAVRQSVGDDFVVAAKLNSADFQKGGFSAEDSVATAVLLQDAGVHFIEVSGGNFESPLAYQHKSRAAESATARAPKRSTALREAYFLEYARAVKAALRIPVMVTGGFRQAAVMNAALAEGATDLIGIGRPFIIAPEFPAALLDGRIDAAPAVERDFPDARDLPPGAALNWFCHQLALHGLTGNADLSLPVVDGHRRYIDRRHATAERLRATRGLRM